MESSKNWKVIREDDDVFQILLELLPEGAELSGQRICRPCFRSVEKVLKNSRKANELLEEANLMKQSITSQLKELYSRQLSDRDSIPVRAKRSRFKKTFSACRSLQFSGESPGVVVSVSSIVCQGNLDCYFIGYSWL